MISHNQPDDPEYAFRFGDGDLSWLSFSDDNIKDWDLRARAERDVDYIQDPATGRFEGSHGHGGGEAFGFSSPNVLTNLDLKGAVHQLGGKQQAALEKAAQDVDKAVGIDAKQTSIIGAWSDGAENSVMTQAAAPWGKMVAAEAMKGYLANQKTVLVFQQQDGGQSVLATFQAKGSIEDIHKSLLQDGIAFHTLVPVAGGAMVHVADTDGSMLEAIKKGAERYGSTVDIKFGRAQFIGDTSEFVGDKAGTGTDAEQRDRALSVYEGVIAKSEVAGIDKTWRELRDNWSQTLGGKFQQIAEQAVSRWQAEHPRTKEATAALVKDIDKIVAEGNKFENYRDWYARHKELAKDLFGEHEPYFEKFLAATSINTGGKDNVSEALRATIHFVNGGTFETKNYSGVLGAVRDQLLHIQHNEPLTGLKVVPFSEALLGNWDRAPADRHMKNLLFQNPSKGPNATQAQVTEVVVGAVAKSMGWKTAEMQAVMWCVQKSREEKGAAAIVFDYRQYMQQQETRTRALLAEHGKLKTRLSMKSVDEDEVGKLLKTEAQAWSNAQLLMDVFEQLQNEFGDDEEAMREGLNIATLRRSVERDVDYIQDPETGRFQGSHGHGGGGEEITAVGNTPNAEVMNVGGDEWNQKTAERLEKEYVAAAPKLQSIIGDAVRAKTEVEIGDGPDPEAAPYVPEDWSMLSGDQQNEAENDYMKSTYNDYENSEQENWYSEYAPDEARAKVAERFTDGKETEWADDIVDEFIADWTEGGATFPFEAKQIKDAITVSYEEYGGGGTNEPDIGFDDSKLKPIGWQEGQQTLPGIEAAKPEDQLTEKMRKDLTARLEKGFEKEAERAVDHLEQPDFSDQIAEYQSDQWGQMDDKDKFSWVTGNTSIVEDAQKEYDDYFGDNKQGGETGVLQMPKKIDPLQVSEGPDYMATRLLARHLSIERAANLMVERKVFSNIEKARSAAKSMDRELWDGWKSSSHGMYGSLLQAAVHDELGGRLNTKTVNLAEQRTTGDSHEQYGGYAGVKAYVRAKWETTQYLLDKAGAQTVNLFRAVNIVDAAPPKVEHVEAFQQIEEKWNVSTVKTFDSKDAADKYQSAMQYKYLDAIISQSTYGSERTVVRLTIPFKDKKSVDDYVKAYSTDPNNPAQHRESVREEGKYVVETYSRLPDIHIVRNGAASASTDQNVPNKWDGDSGRVVLRASVPRTAVLSVPAYGQNVQHEHETVVMGTGWKGWDAWYGAAPNFDKVKIGHQIAKAA